MGAIKTDTQSFKIKTPPPAIGGYNLVGGKGVKNSIQFNLTKKPSAWHRFWTKVFLGWTWIDNK